MKSRICVFALILALLLSGCKPDAEESPTLAAPAEQGETEILRSSDIAFWHPFSPASAAGKYLDEQIRAFNINHPDSRIVGQNLGSCESILIELKEAAAQESTPGILWMCFSAEQGFQQESSPVALESIPAASGLLEILTTVDPIHPSYATSTGSTTGVPLNISVPLLLYRNDLLEQSGIDPRTAASSWHALLDAAFLVKDSTDKPGLALGLDPAWMVEILITEAGGTMLENGSPVFNDRSMMGLFETAGTVFKEGAGLLPSSPADAADALDKGAVAMAVLPNEWAADLADSDMIGVLPSPHQPENAAFTPLSGGSLYILASGAEKQAVAAEFLLFLLEDERLLNWTAAGGVLPAYRPLLEDLKNSDLSPTAAAALEVFDHGTFRTDYSLAYLTTQEIFSSTTEDIFLRAVDPDEALTEAFLKLIDQMGN